MNWKKRFAAALLCAVMALMMLTACGGTTPAALTWETSRTKKYFDAKGISGQEYTMTADMAGTGIHATLQYAVKGKQAGYQIGDGTDMRVDEAGNVYVLSSGVSNGEAHKVWVKYTAATEEAKQYAGSIRTCFGYFVLPDADSVGSITAGKYKMNGKTYEAETIKLHKNDVYTTCTFCYEGDTLSFILMDTANVMLSNVELKGTADQNVMGIPQDYQVAY